MLGLESLEILARIGTVTSKKTLKEMFPSLFQGLGKLQGDYQITLKPGATPYSLNTPRRAPIPLNQLGKFAPNLAERTKPLRDLLQKDAEWTWEPAQQSSLEDLKQLLISSPVLALYDPSFETIVSTDASSFGLGAILLQRQPSGDLKPVAYVSRSMTPTE